VRRASIIVFSALALLLTAGGAGGEEEEEMPSAEQSRRRSAEILAHTEQPEAQSSWLSHHLERIHLHRRTGLAYTRPLRLAERDLEFSLRGPALGPKRVGLSFEISF
jgi:hypothetical protein